MADTTFTARVTTIVATWLQDVNNAVYRASSAITGVTQAMWRTVTDYLLDRNSVLSFMTQAQRNDIRAFTYTLDVSSAIAAAILATPAGGTLIFPYGGYSGYISVRRSNITLLFEGSTIKLPSSTNYPACLELGDLASGNGATAYTGIHLAGSVTLDGNRTGITVPVNDLTGWGLATTKISKSSWGTGVKAINCYNGGVGIFIDSNSNTGVFHVENCGNATLTGPGFDLNSSKYGVYGVTSRDCYIGGRILDNCFGNNVTIAYFNATTIGFIYNNQAVNESRNNNIDVTGITSGTSGLVIGLKCRGGNIRAAIYGATTFGCDIINDATPANKSRNLNIDLTTENSGAQGLRSYGDDCTVRHQSYLDGRTGAQGSVFAVDVLGDRNKLIVDLIDSATWQVRGVVFRAGATDNHLMSYTYTNSADPISDSGTRTRMEHGMGMGTDIASANGNITIPFLGSVFNLTGANTVTSITASSCYGRVITLITPATAGLTDGSNLKLTANFAGSADDTLTLACDGTNWYEVSRASN